MSAPDDRDDDPFRPPADDGHGRSSEQPDEGRRYGWGSPPQDPARSSWEAAQQRDRTDPGGADTSSYQEPSGWQQPYGSPAPYGGTAEQQTGDSWGRSPGQVPGQGHDQGYGQGGPQGYGYAVPDHPRATTSMVLGICSLVGGLLCLVPLLLAPFALVMGRRAVKDIDAGGGRVGGRGQAQAGFVMGIIGTVLLAIGFVVVALLGVAITSSFA